MCMLRKYGRYIIVVHLQPFCQIMRDLGARQLVSPYHIDNRILDSLDQLALLVIENIDTIAFQVSLQCHENGRRHLFLDYDFTQFFQLIINP
ncbi:hypothetical protein D9M72_521960 [compost metagenome]